MKDVIYVENHYFVTVKEHSIKFRHTIDKSEQYYMLDDIEALIFDHPRSYFTQKLVAKCIEYNIGIIFCDNTHSPIASISSEYRARHRLKRIQSQLQLLGKTKSRLWKKVVVCKIANQSLSLENNRGESEWTRELLKISKDIRGNDKENREALAARIYFRNLYGVNFRRGRYDDIVNSALNYGYAIVRGFIKKELAYHGVEMSLGFHHHSLENPFNLADDLIEPYRPFVDTYVYDLVYNQHVKEFNKDAKRYMLNVLFVQCIIDKQIVRLVDGIKETVNSYIASLDRNSPSPLILPKVIEVGV